MKLDSWQIIDSIYSADYLAAASLLLRHFNISPSVLDNALLEVRASVRVQEINVECAGNLYTWRENLAAPSLGFTVCRAANRSREDGGACKISVFVPANIKGDSSAEDHK